MHVDLKDFLLLGLQEDLYCTLKLTAYFISHSIYQSLVFTLRTRNYTKVDLIFTLVRCSICIAKLLYAFVLT